MIPSEQVDQIKQQIIQQIESTLPEDKKASVKSQIQNMDPGQLEEFLKQNNMMRQQGQSQGGNQCIFCSIVFGDVPSTKIDEDESSIAILEINPVSKGHVIIIPKAHNRGEKDNKKTLGLAKKVSDILNKKLSPKEIKITGSEMFGHDILNVIPVYENETLNSPRHQTKKEDLEDLQKQLFSEKKKTVVKKPKTKKVSEKNLWLPKRIP